ncbi:MAG: lamin tail domain-containing protein [Fibrobacterales bacterium]
MKYYILYTLLLASFLVTSCTGSDEATTAAPTNTDNAQTNGTPIDQTQDTNPALDQELDTSIDSVGNIILELVHTNIQAFSIDSVYATLSGLSLTFQYGGKSTISNDTISMQFSNIPVGNNYEVSYKFFSGGSLVVSETKENILVSLGTTSKLILDNKGFPRTVLINEVSAGPKDWFEVINVGSTDINLKGWTFNYRGYNNTTSYKTDQEYVIKSDVIIQANGLLVVSSDSATDTANELFLNSDFVWTTKSKYPNQNGNGDVTIIGVENNYNMLLMNEGSIGILDENGTLVDYVCWVAGETGVMDPNKWYSAAIKDFTVGKSISRKSTEDTNTDADWKVGEPTRGTNPLQ